MRRWWKEKDYVSILNEVNITADEEKGYKNMKVRIELLEVLAEAEDDAKNGRVEPITETFDDLRKMLQEGSMKLYINDRIM